jgi:hypothetical protein
VLLEREGHVPRLSHIGVRISVGRAAELGNQIQEVRILATFEQPAMQTGVKIDCPLGFRLCFGKLLVQGFQLRKNVGSGEGSSAPPDSTGLHAPASD